MVTQGWRVQWEKARRPQRPLWTAINGQQGAEPAPDNTDWESAQRWGLSCHNLNLPEQFTHPCLYMKAMRWEGSTVRVWHCSSPVQLQARVNILFKDEQLSLKGKPRGFQPSQEGHKWVQETREDLHKGKELNPLPMSEELNRQVHALQHWAQISEQAHGKLWHHSTLCFWSFRSIVWSFFPIQQFPSSL